MIGYRLFVFLSLFLGIESYTTAQQTQLHTNLLNGYDRRIRPGSGASKTEILTGFHFATLKEFSESEGKIAMVGAISFMWVDTRLSWDPTLYGNDLTSTYLFVKDIWTPKMVNMNPYVAIKAIGADEMLCQINNAGEILLVMPDLFESTCDADVTYYPFDDQKCSLKYYIPGYSSDDVNIVPSDSSFDMSIYEANGLWDIKNTIVSVETKSVKTLVLTVQMTRRTTYYIAGLLLPIVLMNFIQVLVFIIPVESGERVGYCITVLLAIAVFLTMIQDKLPESSEPNVSLLTYKLLVDMFIGCGMILAVVIGLTFYFKAEDKQIPGCLRGFTRCCYVGCSKKHPKQTIVTVVPEKNDQAWSPEALTWHDVGKAFDRFCLALFFLSLILNNSIYLIAILSV